MAGGGNKQNRHLNRDRHLVPIHGPKGTIPSTDPISIVIDEEVARDILLDNTGTVPIYFTFKDPADHPVGQNLWKLLKPGSVFGAYCNFTTVWMKGMGASYEILYNAEGQLSFSELAVSIGVTEVLEGQLADLNTAEALIMAGIDEITGKYRLFRFNDKRLMVDAQISLPQNLTMHVVDTDFDEWEISEFGSGQVELWESDRPLLIGRSLNNDGVLDSVAVYRNRKCRILEATDVVRTYTWATVAGVRKVTLITFTSAVVDTETAQTNVLSRVYTYDAAPPYDLLEERDVLAIS